METPKEVIRELEKIRNQSEQGVALLAEAEIKYLELASAATIALPQAAVSAF